ncbi:hypothetical protein P7L87_25690 [Vibrio parahaemolyticus]|nr:hypothetical protein [Vibrio parahaemolyticus]
MSDPETHSRPGTGAALLRLRLRLSILVGFAIFSRQDAAMVLKNLMIMASSFCVVLAQVRREELTASVLTHWDEAAVYGLAYAALSIALRGPTA